MAFTKAWRDFKRMQDVAVAASALIYAGAVVHAFSVLPGGAALVARHALIWPAGRPWPASPCRCWSCRSGGAWPVMSG